MKVIVLLAGLAALFITAGCEEEHEHHHHEGAGGAYEGYDRGYNYGTYQDNRDYPSYPRNYQGYGTPNPYPYH